MSRSADHGARSTRGGRRFVRGLGWVLVIASFPIWLGLFAAPFLPLPAAQRVVVAGGLAVVGEVMFWVGGAILGASVVARFRKPKVRNGRSFAGKSVAVLGATGGLGTAIVEALEREGASVLAVGRDRQRLEALAAGRPALSTAVADATSEQSLAAAAATTRELDAVVVAIGVDVRKPLAAHTAEDIRVQLDTNLGGAILITRAFADRLRDGGTIVLLGGFGDGRLGLPYYSADVASRAGVSAFAQAMNREFALEGRDLRVSYACPAPADTPAERPFAEVWQRMGTPLVSAEKAADFVLVATLRRRGVAVMGRRNALISRVNTVSPWLADVLGMKKAGRQLREAFGASGTEGAP
jgi:NAD(P)-dependent dehydrogenase (short-subunit alcohol dehydrogenase family)